jgi:hypothetical protein
LSRFEPGDAAVAFYYDHNYTPMQALAVCAFVILFGVGVVWSVLLIIRRRKSLLRLFTSQT